MPIDHRTRVHASLSATCGGVLLALGCFALGDARAAELGSKPTRDGTSITFDSGRIEVIWNSDDLRSDFGSTLAPVLADWMLRSASAVEGYFGQFPVKESQLQVHLLEGRGIMGGQALPYARPIAIARVGMSSTAEDLADDWVLTHEFIHLAIANLEQKHNWLHEGIATYVEPIARAQAGQTDWTEVWRNFIRSMPQGLPAAGDRGLDQTPTWGRTYWGGAIFCLLADVRIRQQSTGRYGLQDALRATVEAGLVYNRHVKIEELLSTADQATGTTALSDLYTELAQQAGEVDLDALWTELGLSLVDDELIYNEHAPSAAVRQAIMRGSL